MDIKRATKLLFLMKNWNTYSIKETMVATFVSGANRAESDAAACEAQPKLCLPVS
jgi:hypothetical protein